MRIDELIVRLEDLKASGEDMVPRVFDLIEMAYSKRTADEHRSRDRMIRQVIRAKRDAGFPLSSKFFEEVWPTALKALKGCQQ